MAEYIKKEDIGLTDFEIVLCKGDYKEALKMLLDKIENLPAADVCPVMEVEEAVDEAIHILNAINASGRMDYGDYSKLHDAICTISNNCGADMRENDNG